MIIWFWPSHTETYLEVFCPLQSGLGLGPRACWPSFLKLINRTPRAAEMASDAIDDTENSDRSVVTDSCDGERSIRHATVSTGVCGGCCVVVDDERLLVSTLDEAITFGRLLLLICKQWMMSLLAHTHTLHIATARSFTKHNHTPQSRMKWHPAPHGSIRGSDACVARTPRDTYKFAPSSVTSVTTVQAQLFEFSINPVSKFYEGTSAPILCSPLGSCLGLLLFWSNQNF